MTTATRTRRRRVLTVLACLLLGPPLWNVVVTEVRLQRHPPPGAFYDVDGRPMYLYCVGSGSPAVVIESALSSDSFGWYGVQASLARTTTVCAYDRSGLGFSAPRPRPRDAEAISRQLHTLLDRAGVPRPFVAMGWSAGGLYVREYARAFPDDLSGLVLVDASVPGQLDVLEGARASYDAETQTLPRAYWWERVRTWLGWERLRGRCWNGPASDVLAVLSPSEAARLSALYVAKTCRPDFIGGELGELLDFERSSAQAARLQTFGPRPLLVITEDPDSVPPTATPAETANKRIWSAEQERLKALSPQSWRVIARRAGHAIHHDRPDVIVSQVEVLIAFLRGGPPPPFGATVRQ